MKNITFLILVLLHCTIWANAQTRFTSQQPFAGGTLYIGDTNIWISTDSKYVRIILTQELGIFNEIESQINSF